MRYDRGAWRKLYRQEPLDQRGWPLVTRAVRDHLIRYPEDLDGFLLTVDVDDPERVGGHEGTSGGHDDLIVSAMCAALGTHPNEREHIERAVRTLMRDKYIVMDKNGRVSIRNFEEAQKSKDAIKKANQRAKKKGDNRGHGGDNPGTPGGHIGDEKGTTEGQHGGQNWASRARAVDLDQKRREEDISLPSSPVGAHEPPRDPMGASLRGAAPRHRKDVQDVHAHWAKVMGRTGAKLGLGADDVHARVIAEAIDAYSEQDCLRVLDVALDDGMVNGSHDSGKEHKDVGYLFGNPSTFSRLLGMANKKQTKSSTADEDFDRLFNADATA